MFRQKSVLDGTKEGAKRSKCEQSGEKQGHGGDEKPDGRRHRDRNFDQLEAVRDECFVVFVGQLSCDG